MDQSDALIARAALAPPAAAVEAWKTWREQHSIETASGLLIWAGGYIHRNLKDAGVEDPYLAGIHRHNWVSNNSKVISALPIVRALSARWSITPLKSFGMSAAVYSRGLRPLADFDFYVAAQHSIAVADFLRESGFTPLMDVSDGEFSSRIMPQRGSWNFLDQQLTDVDLHWRFLEHLDYARSERLVTRNSTTQDTEFGRVRVLSDELMLVSLAVHHQLGGVATLHGLFDFYHLLRTSDPLLTARLSAEVGAARDVRDVCATLRDAVGSDGHERLLALEGAIEPRAEAQPRSDQARLTLPIMERLPEGRHVDRAYLKRPGLYRAWFALGKPGWLERALIRALGSMSRPQRQQGIYGPTGPSNELPAGGGQLGAGWHYRYPADSFRWANIPDTRLVFPTVPAAAKSVRIVLDSASWAALPAAEVEVYANGTRIGLCERSDSTFEFALPARAGGLLEISFRPAGHRRFRTPGIHAKWYRLLAPIAEVSLVTPTSGG